MFNFGLFVFAWFIVAEMTDATFDAPSTRSLLFKERPVRKLRAVLAQSSGKINAPDYPPGHMSYANKISKRANVSEPK